MEVVTVVPVKSLDRAKSRLAPFMPDAQRRRLVTGMLRRVIRAAQKTGAEVWVLGADDSTHSIALQEVAMRRREEGTNVNESLEMVFEEVWTAGKSPLFLPGDLPFIQPEDIAGLISTAIDNPSVGAVREPPIHAEIILSPAGSGGGTNAILISQRLDFQLQLGPGSFARHVEEARRVGVAASIFTSDGLARDLDTWKDLREYEAREPGFLSRLTGEG